MSKIFITYGGGAKRQNTFTFCLGICAKQVLGKHILQDSTPRSDGKTDYLFSRRGKNDALKTGPEH
jgi:hypothetical protein